MKLNKTLSIIAGAMLLLAIPSIWPYGFYQLLRWIVCSIGLFNAYTAHEQGLKWWAVTMVFVAILFNPIAPITFAKEVWMVFDFVVAIVMFFASTKFKN